MISSIFFIRPAQLIQCPGQFRIFFRIQMRISVQCGFSRFVSKPFRNRKDIKFHINQHTDMGVPEVMHAYFWQPSFFATRLISFSKADFVK